MSKQAVSVTLAADNLLWLQGQVRASGGHSLSAVLDRLISAARSAGRVHDASVRSVVGTVRIASYDQGLSGADAAVRALFEASLVAEATAKFDGPKKTARQAAVKRARR